MSPARTTSPVRLAAVKLVHTIVWAAFAGCILAIPVAAWHGDFRIAAWLVAIVAVEVAILVLNGLRCPLTAVAARYTVYLPEWLARHNKGIFGILYLAGTAYAAIRWSGA